MPWTDFYPVLDDSQIADYESHATAEEQTELEEWCAVARKVNPQESVHLVAVSLFWKHLTVEESEFPVRDRQQMMDAAGLGLISRYPPWEHYVVPLLRGAAILREARPAAVLRVYLAADLEFLLDDLVAVGCEVYLMENSSIRHNPGALWRFLALEEAGKWVTVIDADRGVDILSDVERTEQVMAADLGLWRLPYYFDKVRREHHPSHYRPINACQFGAKGGQPIVLLMKAFIWHNRRGTMPTTWRDPADPLQGVGQPIAVTTWPSYGFDEWFLLAALYPRLAFEGVLTFFHWQSPVVSFCHTLDVEYVTWANPRSEVFRCPKPTPSSSEPWLVNHSGRHLAVREDTTVICRERQQWGVAQDIFKQPAASEIQAFAKFQGTFPEMLGWAENHISTLWWLDLNPRLKLGECGGELFCDQRYAAVDVVICGHTFARTTREIATWAAAVGLEGQHWHENGILKFPKVEGPMTLWRTAFSLEFSQEWSILDPPFDAGILLQAWIELERANVLTTTAEQMGWSVR